MIQRIQTLYLFIVTILQLTSVLLIRDRLLFSGKNVDLLSHYILLIPTILLVVIPFWNIFQFKNRLRQIKIVSFARTAITVSFFLFIFTRDESLEVLYYGGSLLIIPYIILFLSAYFIKKDEKLVKSADRIR